MQQPGQPGANPDPAGTGLQQVTSGIVFPGGASVTKTLTQTGTWTFLCRLHSSYSGGAWSGMVGTAVVTAGTATNPPSGVDYTEYRVNGGEWTRKSNTGNSSPFVTTFQTKDVTIAADPPIAVQLDGDVAGATPARFTVDPGAVRIVVPATA